MWIVLDITVLECMWIVLDVTVRECIFAALCSQVGEIEPKGQFCQRFKCSFYACRSQKRKKDWQLECHFCVLGICNHKSCTYNVDEIDTRWMQFISPLFFYYHFVYRRRSFTQRILFFTSLNYLFPSFIVSQSILFIHFSIWYVSSIFKLSSIHSLSVSFFISFYFLIIQ